MLSGAPHEHPRKDTKTKGDNYKHQILMAIEKWTGLLEDRPLSDDLPNHVCEACDATLVNITDTSKGPNDLCSSSPLKNPMKGKLYTQYNEAPCGAGSAYPRTPPRRPVVDVPHAGVAQDDREHPGGRAQPLEQFHALANRLEAPVEVLVEVPDDTAATRH